MLAPGCQSQLLHHKSIILLGNLVDGEWSCQGLDGVANLPHQAWFVVYAFARSSPRADPECAFTPPRPPDTRLAALRGLLSRGRGN